MKELEVRIVKLEPLKVVCASGFGTSPEEQAWQKLGEWAAQNGLLENYKEHRFFGFNNPSPSPGSPNYGYDQWMVVDPATENGNGLELRDFSGGLYAVTRCQLQNISEVWRELALWCENSQYRMGHHQWLEECLTPEVFLLGTGGDLGEVVFDLYLPLTR